MATRTVQGDVLSNKLLTQWEQVGEKLAALAAAMPENKFDYSPAEGVRTVAEILRHVAFWNKYATDSALGKKPNGSADELPKAEFASREKIITALKQSTQDATTALKRQKLSPELAEMLVTFLEHNCEHYGQLVVYARLNSVVPPTSRG